MTTTEITATPVAPAAPPAPARPAPRPDLDADKAGTGEKILIATFVVVPMLALIAAVPLAWGWGITWQTVVIAVVFYMVSGLGISMAFTGTSPTRPSRRTGASRSRWRSPAAWPSRARC